MNLVEFDFWKFFAGIGIFLWGMHHLENAIKELGGKSFRGLLHKYTDVPWKGILIGTLITAVLQSSSLVSLMVLAFLGAGMLNLKNALGIVLGANLGTTATAWIVASLGFKLSVEAFALPFLGIGSFLFLLFSNRPNLKNIGILSIGFGLLFLGLDFMKTAIEAIADQVELDQFLGYGGWVYLMVGLVVTALIQSSSAMIVIILSTMNAGLIGLEEGAAMVIGANIGTTVTLSIGALGGTADKKRLALANFLFKVVAGLLVFLFLEQFIGVTRSIFFLNDPLMELVLFNSLFNIFGIILFYPFINKIENWLRKRFNTDEPQGSSRYIKNVSPEVPSVALAALEKEIALAYQATSNFILNVWHDDEIEEKHVSIWRKILFRPVDLLTEYNRIKSLDDEITKYQLLLQAQSLTEEESHKLSSLMLSLRLLTFAAKDIKDVMHNIQNMESEEDRIVLDLHNQIKNYTMAFLDKLDDYNIIPEPSEIEPEWIIENARQYKLWISDLYEDLKSNNLEFPISTLTNVIKQVVSSLDNLGGAVVHWKNSKKELNDPLN